MFQTIVREGERMLFKRYLIVSEEEKESGFLMFLRIKIITEW